MASGVIALPLGVRIEQQYKRPVMITADLVRCAVLASIPVAMEELSNSVDRLVGWAADRCAQK
ncbi:hypothetical protein [Streptomyces rhizosphaerihabitans]|uniref:hypothetical protein n=1 Tax=Streptomyces rhizosphaerihabitans TaxID=1266770 RepID=UPI0021C0AEFC|nr:hypothetical protein [Streptomyces rhizosphaerihabitans]MCT9011796.1 hypothetical protein [Streptomyces rhizosphaerihabitans]